MKKIILVISILIIEFFLISDILLALKIKTTFEQQIQSAEFIFVGQVISTESVKIDKTYFERVRCDSWVKVGFKISEILKDKTKIAKEGEPITYLHFMGGEGVWVEDVPEFNINENVILVLYTNRPIKEKPFFITADVLGSDEKFIIKTTLNSGKQVVFLDQRPIIAVRNGDLVCGDKTNLALDINLFKKEIKHILKTNQNKHK